MARPTLKKGMSGKAGTEVGEAILLWRMFLGKPELKPAAGTTSYDFGNATDKYTREFQAACNLPVNGVVDDRTWAAYDAKMAVSVPVVQAKAAAAETAGAAKVAAQKVKDQQTIEAHNVAVMAATVQGKPAPKPTAAVKAAIANKTSNAKATAPQPSSGTTAEDTAANVAWYKKAQAAVKTKTKAAAAKTREKVEHMTVGGVITAGVLGLAALVGYKAVKKSA